MTRIVKTICWHWTIWPEQLLGRSGAGSAVSSPTNPPLATGHSPRPRVEARFALARRFAWRVAFLTTDLSVENIAEAIGGLSPGYVSRWTHSWKPFAETEDKYWVTWRLWLARLAETCGVARDDLPWTPDDGPESWRHEAA